MILRKLGQSKINNIQTYTKFVCETIQGIKNIYELDYQQKVFL